MNRNGRPREKSVSFSTSSPLMSRVMVDEICLLIVPPTELFIPLFSHLLSARKMPRMNRPDDGLTRDEYVKFKISLARYSDSSGFFVTASASANELQFLFDIRKGT